MKVELETVSLYAPPQVETAEALSHRLGRSAEWITTHTGVARRHIADETVESMGAKAVSQLGGGVPEVLINASLSPRQLLPDTSNFILRELGWEGIPAWSVHATCMSWLVGLIQASSLIQAGVYRDIILVSAEKGSVSRDFTQPESAALIGDGAAAARLRPTPEGGSGSIIAFKMANYPEGAEWAEIRGCGAGQHPNDPTTRPSDHLFNMNGPQLYRHAVRRMFRLLHGLMDETGITAKHIDWVVPHQASGPALASITRMGFAEDRVINILPEYGNCIAASLPMALATGVADGRIKRGDTLLLMCTGAGLSVGAALITW